MKKVLFLILLAVAVPVFAQGGAQQPERPAAGAAGRGQRPVRSQPARADAPRGTSVMRGSIVSADSGSPIRRAQVRVSSPEARESRVATTDSQGRFEIKELPAGRYTMTVSKAGFVTLQYGQRRPSESGTPIELGDGQALDKLSVALPRGSVLGGRIVDEFGEPVANATVMAWRYAYQGGARRMTPGGQNSRDTTDDQGQYRLFGLTPGEYFVSAMLRGGPEYTDPMGEVSGYAATYYPGTPNVAEATRVTLAVSQENTSVNFGLIATRLVRVTGTVMMSDGAPASNGNVALVPVNATGRPGIAVQQGGAGSRIEASNGGFRLANVAPGRYQVQARAGGGRDFELARMELTVGTDDVSGITLVTSPSATLSGTVVSDTGEAFDFRPQQLQIGGRPASPDAMGGPGMQGSCVGDDWSFTIRNLSEPVVIRATPPQGWTLKSVSIGGQDITDTPMEFPAGQSVSGASIVLTKKVSTLSGLVTDAKGNPVLDATVVVFPANEKLWTYQSRFIKAARPDQDGRYRMTALPAEDYLVVALQGLEDGQAGDPEFLASMKELASKLAITEGETKTADVKLSTAK